MTNKNKQSKLPVEPQVNQADLADVQVLLAKKLELEMLLDEQKQSLLAQATAELDAMEEKYGLSIGVKLTPEKIMQVMQYMLANNQNEVSLKFEIW